MWEKGDIFVFPEAFPDFMKAFKDVPVKKIMFCQSENNPLFYIGYQGDFYSKYLANGLIISSKSIGKFIEELYGLSNIPSIIMSPWQKLRPWPIVCYMPDCNALVITVASPMVNFIERFILDFCLYRPPFGRTEEDS